MAGKKSRSPRQPAGDVTDFGVEPETEPLRTHDARTTIGPYRLLQSIGVGGMGEVWLAEQAKPLKRQVALKLIKASMVSKEIVARFESERQALAMMDHPSIARVYDAGTTAEGRPYFAMEYVQGEPITVYCDRNRVPMRERIELMIHVCSAVQHAHQKAIIHRDLKPSNILVTIQANRAVPKVIDFGVAKAIGQKLTDHTMYTEVGQMVGTLDYMSPEQAEMTGQNIDTRTDVYALGVILYELLVGTLPFDPFDPRQTSLDEVVRRIREDDPPRPSTRAGSRPEDSEVRARNRATEPLILARQLKGDLDWITLKALEKDRTRRYGSPEELAADLRRHLNDEPVLASPPSTAYRAKKFVRRHRIAVAFAATLLSALIALAVTMTVQARRIAQERDRANREAEAANAALEFLTDIFEISDPGESRGNTITAREVLDQGASKIATGLRDQPETQARLMGTIGTVYQSLGLYAAAKGPLEEVLAIRRKTQGSDSVDVAKALEDLALLDSNLADYDSAEERYREALAIRRRVQGGEHRDVAWTLSGLANVLASKDERETSGPLFREALEMGRKLLERNDPDLPWLVTRLANHYADVGEIDAAEALYREALALNRSLYGTDHPDVAFAIDNLAMVVHDKGDLEEAEELFLEALAMLRRIYGNEHPEIAQTLDNVAFFLQDIGEYDRAEAMTREALMLNRKLLGEDHPRVADSLSAIAELARLQGREEEAERAILQSLAIYRERLPAGHRKIASAESIYGAVLAARGRYAEAEPLLISSYEALRGRGERAPERRQALERVIALYDAWGKDDEAARYRALEKQP